MRKELQEIEIIENYLMGKMSDSEKADFEKKRKADATLNQNVELQKSLVAGLERMGLKNDLLKAKRSLFARKVGTWFGTAILLTIVAFGIYYNTERGKAVEEIDTEIVEITEEKININELGTNEQNKEVNQLDDIVEKVKDDKEVEVKTEGRNKKNANIVTLEDSGNRQEITPDFAKIPKKAFQIFQIDPTKKNTIRGEEGTVIEIPANAFDTKSKAMVEINLQEFYKLSDIVFANLSTQTSSGELIETGGMVNIKALDFEKKELKLKLEQSISLKFPYEQKKEGMQTFSGERDAHDNVVWEEEVLKNSIERHYVSQVVPYSNTSDLIQMRISDKSERMKKMFAKQRGDVEEYIIDKLRLPILSKNELKGFVYVSFIVESDGKVSETKVNKAGNAPLEAYDYLQKTIKQLPPLVPYNKNGRYVRTEFEIRFDLDKSFNSKMLEDEVLVRYYQLLKKRRGQITEATVEDFEKMLEQRQEEVEGALVEGSSNRKELDSQANQYILSSTNLGWINCDRYPFALKGKSSFNIFSQEKKINASLVLHSVRGIVSPMYIKEGKYIFPELPNGEEVSVLAFKSIENENYVSYFKTTHNNEAHSFEFEPLTKEKLKEITSKLNSIKN